MTQPRLLRMMPSWPRRFRQQASTAIGVFSLCSPCSLLIDIALSTLAWRREQPRDRQPCQPNSIGAGKESSGSSHAVGTNTERSGSAPRQLAGIARVHSGNRDGTAITDPSRAAPLQEPPRTPSDHWYDPLHEHERGPPQPSRSAAKRQQAFARRPRSN